MDPQLTCSLCQNLLPGDDAAFCAECDLYHIKRFRWNSIAEFLQFLDGKKFVYHPRSIGLWCQELNTNIREFANAMITSPDVIEVKCGGFASPEELIGVADLVEKLPNCGGVQIASAVITGSTAASLAKLASFPWIRAVVLLQSELSLEACQLVADALAADPDKFLSISFEECSIPSVVPLFKLLEQANIDTIPYLVSRPLNDDEFIAFTNAAAKNKHLKSIYISNLTSKQSRKLAEAMQASTNAPDIKLAECELVTAIPALVEALKTSQTIKSLCLFHCGLTLALLTQLCEGLKERKLTSDLHLKIMERNYTDSLSPIRMLLEDNVQLSGLTLTTAASVTEWIQVAEGLKKNTTIKALSLSCVADVNDHFMEEILEALKVNTTLRSFFLDTRWFQPRLDPIIIEVISQNKLESVHIASGTLGELNLATICNMLKKNFRLKKITLPSTLAQDTEENIKIFTEMIEKNCFLTVCDIMVNSFQIFGPYKQRNLIYQKEWPELKANMAVILHNLARDAEMTRKMLLIDLWIDIFKRIRHPCSQDSGFESLAKKIFRQYKLY